MNGNARASFAALPGGASVEKGSADLDRGVESIESLLVSIGAARLSQLGFRLAAPLPSPEHRLYELLASEDPDSAHSRYNALVRRLVSFERAAECARADPDRIRGFMRALGREAGTDGSCYFTGGATAVLLGWHRSAIDVDILIAPETDLDACGATAPSRTGSR